MGEDDTVSRPPSAETTSKTFGDGVGDDEGDHFSYRR